MKSETVLLALVGILAVLLVSLNPQTSSAILDLLRGTATAHPMFYVDPDQGASAATQPQTQTQTSETQSQSQTQTLYIGFPMQLGWTYRANSPLVAQPQTDEDAVYCATRSGVVQKVSQKEGKQVWRRNLADGIEEALLYRDGMIYAGTQRGRIYAIRAEDGKEMWSTAVEGESFLTMPAADSKYLYFVGANGTLVSVDPATGKFGWKFKAQGKCASSPAISASLVFLGCADKNFYAVDAAAGFVKWKFIATSPILASPVATATNVMFGSEDAGFYCLDNATGRQRWRFKAGGAIRGQPMLYLDPKKERYLDVFVASFDNFIYDLKIDNGYRKWLTPCGARVFNRMCFDRALIYLAPFGSILYGFDPHTGKQVGTFDAGARIRSSPNTANDRLFLGLNDGRLICLVRQPPPPPETEETQTQTQTQVQSGTQMQSQTYQTGTTQTQTQTQTAQSQTQK